MLASAISAVPAGSARCRRRKRYFGDATALSKILQLNAQLDVPFSLASQRFHYNVQYQRQVSNTPLTPQDQFAIGGRWSVRGFDGERSLNADRGWFVRNDIGLVYAAAVAGDFIWAWITAKWAATARNTWSGNHLAGGAIGVRGRGLQHRLRPVRRRAVLQT